jgi:penicillin-binding protein 1A
MAMMMSHVVSEGTARRAILDGIPAAGKTGTTNAYRDAWFVGYTGNFVCGVWYGNDDYSPTNRLTGGALPAQTWHDIMTTAHRGVEVKDIAGVAAPAKPTAAAAAKIAGSEDNANPAPPPILTKRGAEILVRVEKMLDQAGKTIGKTSAAEPLNPTPSGAPSPISSGAAPFPGNVAAATSGDRPPPAPPKN